MARCNVGEDEAETEIVFDSQGEEDDAWPESQSSEKGTDKDDLIGAQKAKTSRVYGKQGKTYSGTGFSEDDFFSMIDAVSTRPVDSSQTTSGSGNSVSNGAVENNSEGLPSQEIYDPFNFGSSDDDIPLQPKSTLPRATSVTITDTSEHEHPQFQPSLPEDSAALPRRALRARKPEQQMPYTLDLIRHRDQFRRRGLKPVHNPDNARPVLEEDEQYQGDEEGPEVELDKDERYVSATRHDKPRPLKRRRVEAPEESPVTIHLRRGRAFIAPENLFPEHISSKRKPSSKIVQQVTPERDEFDFHSESEDELSILPARPSPGRHLDITPPRQTETPISDAGGSSASPSHRQHHRPTPVIVSDDEDEDIPLPSTLRVNRVTDSSSSESDLNVDEVERMKKRARGVLPGSFFTMRAATNASSKPNVSRRSNAEDRDRRGLAKTKVTHKPAKPSRVSYSVSSEEEGEEENSPDKRNFIDLTREEKIQDDAEGWNIEEDLIDRMLNWGGSRATSRSRNNGLSERKKTKSKPNLERPKRKRQRRINEFTVPAAFKQANPVKQGPRLSVVDACDVYTNRNNRSPPQFMKIARRQSTKTKNFGRRKPPSRKRFSFAEEEDQEDVDTVIQDWEAGIITEGVEQRRWTKPPKPKTAGARPSSGMRNQIGDGAKRTAIKRTPLAPIHEENQLESHVSKPTVNKFLRPGAPIIAIVDGKSSRGKVSRRNIAYSTGEMEGLVRGRSPSNVASTPFSRRTNDIATWLRTTAGNRQPSPTFSEREVAETPVIPPATVSHATRLRKPRRTLRRDTTKVNRRVGQTTQLHTDAGRRSQQLSLDDVWFTSASTSLTFGIASIPHGVFLDADTFMGRRLLHTALKSKPDNVSLCHNSDTQDIESACEKLVISVDQMLDALDDLHLSHGSIASITRVHHQILNFGQFLVNYLSRFTSAEINEIQYFGSKVVRLAENALDRLEGTALYGDLDLMSPLTLVALSFLQVLTAGCYQLFVLTSHELTPLGADQALDRLSRRLLQYLLSGGFEPTQQVIRGLRAKNTQDGGLDCDSILLDVWATVYHLFQKRNEATHSNVPGFWGCLKVELDIEETTDAQLLDRAWYTLMQLSALTVFDADGISRSASKRIIIGSSDSIWNVVEGIVAPFLQSYSTAQNHRQDGYIRTLFGRCYTLISTWGWSHGAKNLLTLFYTFFTERLFDNLKTESFGVFSNFFNSETSLDINSSDTTFMIFLKLVISYVTQQRQYLRDMSNTISRRQLLAASKDLDRFVNRVTPLRTYQSTFAPLDYIALQNHYRLLLTLYWIAPETSRPSVERIRDVLDIEQAPAPAQVICIETWTLLCQIQLKRSEDIASSVRWFLSIFRHAMQTYQSLAKGVVEAVDAIEMDVAAKPKIRASENIVLKALQSLAEVVPLAEQAGAPLIEDISHLVFKPSHPLSPTIFRTFLNVLKQFFDSLPKRDDSVLAVASLPMDQDSQDYGDASFVEEFLAAQEQPASHTVTVLTNICSQLYQVIANALSNVKEKAETLEVTIDTWISGLALLCQHGRYDWTNFLQYGGEWERLRSINSKTSRIWCPYILTRLLTADSAAYFQGQNHFISAWFEGIIEPNLSRQHNLTSILLNVGDNSLILENTMFVKNSAGIYDISSEELFEARPALIIHALANMGRQYDNLLRQGETASLAIGKQTYLDYLHRMLSSMKTNYLELKDTESEDLIQYVSLAQHVVGNIIQYCASFIKETDRTFKDLPILDYFTNGETFPQPGSNEIAYAAQRLRGVARKDSRRPFSNATQTDIFWGIKSFLERSVRNHQEWDFIEFCMLAFYEEGDGYDNCHVRLLRSFVVQEIFCEYLRIAKEMPEMSNPVWSYVLPSLTAVREVYACVWESMLAENILALDAFVADLISVLISMYGILDIVCQLESIDGELYSTVSARIFDFAILADHVAFHLNETSAIGAADLDRTVKILRSVPKGISVSEDDIAWLEMMDYERFRGGYIRATVRREIARNLPIQVGSVSRAKLDQVRTVFNGLCTSNGFEESIEVYM